VKTLGMRIKILVTVDDALAMKFQKNPGSIVLGETPLGAAELRIRLSGEKPVVPVGMHAEVEELDEAQQAVFFDPTSI